MFKPEFRELEAKRYASTAYEYNLHDFPYLRDIYPREFTDKWSYGSLEDLLCEETFIDASEDTVLNTMLNQMFWLRYSDMRIGYDTPAEFYMKLKGKCLELRRKYSQLFASVRMEVNPLLTADITTETKGQDIAYTKAISLSHSSNQSSGKRAGKSVRSGKASNKALAYDKASSQNKIIINLWNKLPA